MSARLRKATLRLQRDLQELAERSWELPTVSALPLEDDILEWHCNIVGTGEHEGTVLHLKLLFPETYPHQPPEVVLMSHVEHPHVFGDHLCLDMLEEGQWSSAEERDAEFTGWSTCYSVFSLLMQLQAFVFDMAENPGQARMAASKCICFCGHGLDRVYPPLPTPLPPPERPGLCRDPFAEGEVSSTRAAEDAEEEEEVSGKVVGMERWGAAVHSFTIELADGRKGWLLKKDVPQSRRLQMGDRVSCWVTAEEPHLSLTMFRSKDSLLSLAESRARVPATVTGVRPFGAFVDLGGHAALLHRTEMELLPRQPIPCEVGETVLVRLMGEPVDSKLAVSARALYLRPTRPRQLLMDECDVDTSFLRCFHSKATLTESILGVGVSLVPEDDGKGHIRYHLSSIFDTLSLESYQDGVRRGVWKQKFSEFLPLAFDSEHFERARRSIQSSLARMASGLVAEKTVSHGKSKADKDAEARARISLDEYKQKGNTALAKVPTLVRPEGSPFVPEMVFEVLTKLMNSQVVLLSGGHLWRCEKALSGYFAYHHLILHFLGAYPRLRADMERGLDTFLSNPDARTKEQVPNIGEFLCCLSLSDKYGWEELGIPILEEVFDRNVLWILKQAPGLGEMTDAGVSAFRLRRSFSANQVSLRLLMFQVAFLQLIKAPRKHVNGDISNSASSLLTRKDHFKGLPGPWEVEWLFDRCVDILDVRDYHEFLELVGAAPMDDAEICRWLRRSVLRSIRKGYHNPHFFASLHAKSKEKPAAGGGDDPEDFGLDTRPKESKSEKRKRRAMHQSLMHSQSAKRAEYQRALNWARFVAPHRYEQRQACVFLDKSDFSAFESALDSSGALRERFQGASAGWRLLDGATLAKVKTFPVRLWLGKGCEECSKAVKCEISGRCMPCCERLAREPQAAKAIKGLTGPNAPVATFTMFQARAITPVQFQMYLDVGFDGLMPDLKPLREALASDLTLAKPLQGGVVFSRVERAGKRLWEHAPEQVMFPGSKLISAFRGTHSATTFKTRIRGFQFTLVEEEMPEMESLDNLDLLRFNRTYCKDHVLKDPKTKEIIWDAPCKNCRGLLRLRFAAPDRYAQRKAQLDSLTREQFAKRALLCGLHNQVAEDAILKSEQIIR